MNRNLIFLVLFALTPLAIASVEGQTVPISSAEFEKVTSAALARSATRPRRETTNAKKFSEGRVVEEELTTQDFAPPDKERWLILARTPEKHSRIEIVYIGDVEYRREDKNPWKKVDSSDAKNETKIVTTSPKPKGPVTYTKEDRTVDGMRLQVFSERSSLRTRAVTMDAYGYILLVDESASEGSGANVVYSSRLSIVYSSHPIIIEAPIK
jgi:hypothetical protein